MKLPELGYKTAVTPIPSVSVQTPLVEANARAAAIGAKFGAAKVATQVATTIISDYAKRETQAQVDKFEYDTAMDVANYVTETDKLINVGIDDVPPEIAKDFATEFGEFFDEKIPAHRVVPEMQRRYAEQVIEERAQGIQDKTVRRTSIAEMRKRSQSNYLKALTRSHDQQKIYNAATGMMRYNTAVREGKYNVALELIPTLDLSENEQNALIEDTKIKREGSVYNDQMTRRDVEGLTKSLDILTQSQESYTSSGGMLDAKNRNIAANAIRSTLKSIENSGKAKVTTQTKLDNREAQRATQEIIKGNQIDYGRIDYLIEATKATNPVTSKNLEILRTYAAELQNVFLQQPLYVMERELRQVKADATKTPDGAYVYDLYRAAFDHAVQAIPNDTMGYAMDHGIIPYSELDPTDLSGSILKRIPQAAQAKTVLGSHTGYLTESEATEMAFRLDDKNNRNTIMTELNKLGPQASLVYEQLERYGAKGPYLIAGQALATGGEAGKRSAKRILEGSDIRKENPQILSKEVLAELREDMADITGATYYHNMKRGNNVNEATLDAYVSILQETRSNPEDVEKSYLREAFLDASGGAYKVEGAWIEAPNRTVNGATFRNWYKKLHHSYIDVLGKPLGYTSEQVMDGLQNGDYKLETLGKNRYLVVDTTTDNNQYIMDENTGEAFEFMYMQEAMTKDRASREEYVKQFGTEEGEKLYEKQKQIYGEEFIPPVERTKQQMGKSNIAF